MFLVKTFFVFNKVQWQTNVQNSKSFNQVFRYSQLSKKKFG